MSRRKWIVVGLAGVAVVVAAGVVLKMRNRGPQNLEVEAAPAAKMKIVETVAATGRVQPVTQVNISADVSAKIIRLKVAEGDWVERGALLLELDREQYQAAFENAQASLRVAQANVTVAEENRNRSEKDYQRVRNMFDQQLETQAALDGAQAQFQAERARHQSATDQVEQQRAALKQAQDALSKTRIYAPISGSVSRLNKEVGEIAVGSQFQSDVILELSNLGGMEALVDVDENDVVRVARGDAATIEVDALPGVTLHGEVTEIASSAKMSAQGTAEQKTEFEVKVGIRDATPALRPGMTASTEIVTETHDGVLGVPIQSVAVRTPDQLKRPPAAKGPAIETPEWTTDKDGFVSVVFTVVDGIALAKQVKTGIQSETHIEVTDGLTEGQEIVTGSYRAISRDLQHGTPVAKKTGPPATAPEAQARR